MLTTGTLIGKRVPFISPLRKRSDARGAALGEGGVLGRGASVAGAPCMVSESRSVAPVGGTPGESSTACILGADLDDSAGESASKRNSSLPTRMTSARD